MQVCLEDLLQLDLFSSVHLITGRMGLERLVSGAYICLSKAWGKTLLGNELLFLPEAAMETDEEAFLLFLSSCVSRGASGLVLLTKHPLAFDANFGKIREECQRLTLPLLQLSPEEDLLKITQEISDLLQSNSRLEENTRHFLENVLFEQFKRPDEILRMAKFYHVNVMPVYFISILGNSLSVDTDEFASQLVPAILRQINGLNKKAAWQFTPVTFADTVLVLAFAVEESQAQEAMLSLSTMCQNLRLRYLNAEIALSFSRIHEDLTEIPASYREASQTLLMLRSANYPSYILKYEELGITRLLFELTGTAEVRRYCMENLKPILDYDKEHSSDLLFTLKGYFMNNKHLVNTSNALYVHRNTLVYRLSIIKELLGRDLDHAMTALELFNSILIYEFLQQ